MRSFQIMPTSPGQHVHHRWMVVATEEDGSQVTLDTYATVADAEAAILALGQAQRTEPE